MSFGARSTVRGPLTMPKVAVVTGGTAGIGRATVRELARREYDVAVLARGDDGLEATAKDIHAQGRRALMIKADVADAAAVEAAADQVEETLGPIDAIVGFTQSVRTELRHAGSRVSVSLVALPGTNTPQFGWVLRRGIEHHPRPVAPVYQPEVGATAVAHVAEHPRRSTWVGAPTYWTILGGRLVPGFMDWYLARTTVAAQQAPEHDPPPHQHNLWHPRPGDAGAHGVFDGEAHRHSPLLRLTTHRRLLATGLGAGLGAVATVRAGRGRSRDRAFRPRGRRSAANRIRRAGMR